jgi:hypothetical protein
MKLLVGVFILMVIASVVVMLIGYVVNARKSNRIADENMRRCDVVSNLIGSDARVRVKLDEDDLYVRFEDIETGWVVVFFDGGDHTLIPPLNPAGVRVIRGARDVRA